MPVVCVYMNHVGDAHDENGEEIQQVECVMATNIPNEMDQVEDSHICVVMVGLPARGKSLIAQKSELPSPFIKLRCFSVCQEASSRVAATIPRLVLCWGGGFYYFSLEEIRPTGSKINFSISLTNPARIHSRPLPEMALGQCQILQCWILPSCGHPPSLGRVFRHQ